MFLLALVWLWPVESGRWATVRIFLPQLAWLLVLPLALGRRKLLFLLLGLELMVLCPPRLHLPGRAEGEFTVLSWNCLHQPVEHFPAADLVVLQEKHDLSVERLGEFYPACWNRGAPPDLAIVSRWPILERGTSQVPGDFWGERMAWVRLQPPRGASILLVDVHPAPPEHQGYSLQPARRNAQLRQLRTEVIEPALARGERLLVVGDFNTCEREPMYSEMTCGLHDVFNRVGLGWQTTWAPRPLTARGVGLIRIDYLLCSPNLTPLSMERLAPGPSDHFPLRARFRL